MAGVKLWRLAVLAIIPAAMIGIQDQVFPSSSYSHGGHTLREDVRSAVWRLENQELSSFKMESAAHAGGRSEGRVKMAVIGHETPGHLLIWRELRDEVARLPARDSATRVTVIADYNKRRDTYFSGFSSNLGRWDDCVHQPNLSDWGTVADSHGVALPPMLGQCAFSMAFGEPGPAVRSWIAVMRLRPGVPAFVRLRASEMDSTGRRVIDAGQGHEYWWSVWQEADLRELGCRDGDLRLCRVVLEGTSHGALRGAFMWWLVRRSPEQFRTFWKAGGSYEEAARAGFGEPLTALMSRFLSEQLVLTDRGPTLPAEAPWAFAYVLTLAVLVSLLLSKRRVLA